MSVIILRSGCICSRKQSSHKEVSHKQAQTNPQKSTSRKEAQKPQLISHSFFFVPFVADFVPFCGRRYLVAIT
jgi:hypothetical protein